MKKKRFLFIGSLLIILFIIWTVLVQVVDVQCIGVNGTSVGFASMNKWFHSLTGVHMNLYVITDWLGLVPLFACLVFGVVGLVQLIKRRSLFKVDYDILILGVYYVLVILGYLTFEMITINYRPILINGVMEVSYPSSTTLLVLSVMPTVLEQVNRRVKSNVVRMIIRIMAVGFSLFMVVGRLISGVHWFSDIVGGVLLSLGLYYLYKGIVLD